MSKIFLLFTLLLAPFLTYGQESVKVIVFGELVEITSQPRDENSDFVAVEIKVKQKVIKRFSANSVLFPQIVGTFNWIDGDYVIYRTSMGTGKCVRGSIYVLKFSEDQSSGTVSGVLISPELNTCLGEYPLFEVNYKGKERFALSIGQHEIEMENFDKWIEIKPPAKKVKNK